MGWQRLSSCLESDAIGLEQYGSLTATVAIKHVNELDGATRCCWPRRPEQYSNESSHSVEPIDGPHTTRL